MSFQPESETERFQHHHHHHHQQQQQQQTINIASPSHDGRVTECQRDARVPSSSSLSSSSANQLQQQLQAVNPGVGSDDREDHQVPSSSSSSSTTPPPSSSSSSSSPSSSSLHAGGAQPPHKQGGGSQSIIRCSICSKTFNNSSALAKHKLIHSDERKYACQKCNKSFKRQDHLNGHMMTHAEQKPFRCQFDQCEKSYCDNRSLRRHYENHHQHQLLIPPQQQQQQKNSSATSNLPESAILTPGLTPRSAGPLSATEGTIFNFENIDLRRFHIASTTDGGSAEGPTSVPPSPSTFSQLQMSPVSPATGQQKLQDVNPSSIFPFNEPKPVVCTVCSKRFKNTPALNGHMRLHGGYTKKPQTDEKEKPIPSSGDVKQSRPAKQLENHSPSSRHDDSSALSSPLVRPDPSTPADDPSNVPGRPSSPDLGTGADSLLQTVGRWLREASPPIQKPEKSPRRWVSTDAQDCVPIKREKSEDVEKDMFFECLRAESQKDSLASSFGSFAREMQERDFVRALARVDAATVEDGRENSRLRNGISGDAFVWSSFASNLLRSDSAGPVNVWSERDPFDPKGERSTVARHEINSNPLERSDLAPRVLGPLVGEEKLSTEPQGMVLDNEESMDDDQVIELLYNLENGEAATASGGLSQVTFSTREADITFGSDPIGRDVEPTRRQLDVSLARDEVDFIDLRTDAIIIPPESIFRPSQSEVSLSLTPPMNRGHPVEGLPLGKNSTIISEASENVGNVMSFTLQAVPADQFTGSILLRESSTEEPATPSFAFQQKCSLRGDQVDDQESMFSFQKPHLSQVSFSVLDSNAIPRLFAAPQRRAEMENVEILLGRGSPKHDNVFALARPGTYGGQRQFLGSQEIDSGLLPSQILFGEPRRSTDSESMERHLRNLNAEKMEANEIIAACLNKLKADELRRNMFQNSTSPSEVSDSRDSNMILMEDRELGSSGFRAAQNQKETATRAFFVPASGTAILPVQRVVELRGQNFVSGSEPEQTIIFLNEQDLLNLRTNTNLLEVKLVESQDDRQAVLACTPPSKNPFDRAFSIRHEGREPSSSSSASFMLDHHRILPGQRTKRKIKPQPLNIPFSANNFHSHGVCAGGIKRPSSPQKSVPSPRRLKSSHSPLATPQPLRVIPEGSACFSKLAPPQSAPPLKKDFDLSLYSFDVLNDLKVPKFLSASDEDSRP